MTRGRLALFLLMVISPVVAAAQKSDGPGGGEKVPLESVVAGLEARRAAFPKEGRLAYTHYLVRVEQEGYAQFKSLVTGRLEDEGELRRELQRLLESPLAVRLDANRGTLWFRHGRYRLVRTSLLEDFAPDVVSRLEEQAAKTGARLRLPAKEIETLQDDSIDCQAELVDGKMLYVQPRVSRIAPVLPELDITMHRWQDAIDIGPARGQTITATSLPSGDHVIEFSTRREDGSFSGGARYIFASRRFSSPESVTVYERDRVSKEILYADRSSSLEGPRWPVVTMHAEFLGDTGRVDIALWVVEEMAAEAVPDRQLRLCPSERFHIVDQTRGKDRIIDPPAERKEFDLQFLHQLVQSE